MPHATHPDVYIQSMGSYSSEAFTHPYKHTVYVPTPTHCLCACTHTHTQSVSTHPYPHTVCVHTPIPTHSLCTYTHIHTQSVCTHPYPHTVCVHTPIPTHSLTWIPTLQRHCAVFYVYTPIPTHSLCTHTHTHTQSVYTHPYPHPVCVHTPILTPSLCTHPYSHPVCTHTHTHTQSEGSDSAEALCSFMVSCSSSTLWTLPKKSVSSTLSGSRWNRSVRALTVEMHWWRGHTCSCARNPTDTLDKQVILINSNHNKERLVSTDASTIIINKSENNNYTELTEQF